MAVDKGPIKFGQLEDDREIIGTKFGVPPRAGNNEIMSIGAHGYLQAERLANTTGISSDGCTSHSKMHDRSVSLPLAIFF